MRRLYPRRPIVGVGAVLVGGNRILLEKRRSDPGKGLWSIPGGIVELGESTEETVIREVEEETCLKVVQPRLIDVVSNIILDEKDRPKYHFVIVNYLVKMIGGKLEASDDAADLRWVSFDEVENYDLTNSFRDFFIRNRKMLEDVTLSL